MSYFFFETTLKLKHKLWMNLGNENTNFSSRFSAFIVLCFEIISDDEVIKKSVLRSYEKAKNFVLPLLSVRANPSLIRTQCNIMAFCLIGTLLVKLMAYFDK